MNGRIVLVTGATSGIGRIAARELKWMGARVVVVGRDPARLDQAKRELAAETIRADLSVLAEVHRAADEFRSRFARLDVLINNAGAIFGERQTTAEGLERTFALNHMAYFAMTTALLDVLRKSAPSRVVSVASEAARGGRIDFANLMMERGYSAWRQYSNTKLMNLLFAFELARRTEGTGVTSNAVHPGVVATGFAAEGAGWFGKVAKLARPFMISEEKGARTTVWTASEPSLQGLTGKYFVKQREKAPPRAALDAAVAKRLWDETEGILSRTVSARAAS